MRAPKQLVTDVEPDSTPTPPPVSVRLDPDSFVAPADVAPAWQQPGWRRAAAAVLFAAPLLVFVGRAAAPALAAVSPELNVVAAAEPAPPVPAAAAAAFFPLGASIEASAAPVEARADEHLNRDGRHHPLHGGVLFTPKTFASADGSYDLYIHFHGNTQVVLESAEVAGVNAFVALINLGIGSAPYENDYLQPGAYGKLLAEIQHGIEERGLVHPRLRRIALGSWSAGYGAIGSILRQPNGHDHLDAILVLDGIHVGWIDDERTQLNKLNLGPFIEAAKDAARGEFFFSITHSDVLPEDYASSTVTADLLLDAAGGSRHPVDASSAPPHLALESAKNAVSKKLEKHMEPVTEAAVGSLHVRGYRGNTPEHHMAHLLQMGATVMPELAARWEHAPATP